MSKIYSRPRLKVPRLFLYKRKCGRKNKAKVTLVLVVFVAFATLKLILDAVTPIFNTLCENKAISLATIISNSKASEVMKNHTYNELYSVDKDENGNVKMVKANTININEIISEIGIKIEEGINEQGREDIEIALRKFYWNKITFWSRTTELK